MVSHHRQFGPPPPDSTPRAGARPGEGSRLNLLISYGGWRRHGWVDQLPRLLEPMGVSSFRAESGAEAAEMIRTAPVHVAVVDLNLPLERPAGESGLPASGGQVGSGGTRILKLLRRLESPPPTVVVRRPADRTLANQRTLSEALREGAFAVLDDPVAVEQLLDVMRRIFKRYYADRWPSGLSSDE